MAARALIRLVPAAMLVGGTAGVLVWLFKRAIDAVEWLAFGWHADSWMAAALPVVVAAPVVGGLIVGIVLRASGEPDEPGHGVTEVIEAATLDHEEFPHTRIPMKAAVAALSLGSGAALGPEDPAVEIGGALGEAIGRWTDSSHDAVRALVAAGAAAGISAAFLAPIAAVLFAVEVFRVKIVSWWFLLTGIAVVTAYGVMRTLDPEPPFSLPPLAPPLGLPLLLALAVGLAAGTLAAAHIRFMYNVEHSFLRWRFPPRWVKPAIGGVMLGGAGILLPQVVGIGYETIEAVAAGRERVILFVMALMLAKMATMAISFGSGFLGGFFAPSFFIGAMLGAAAGHAFMLVAPGFVGEPTSFAAIGGAAFLAGAVHAPLTAVFVATAVTGSVALLPFLVIACPVSYFVAKGLEGVSLYTYAVREHEEDRRSRHDIVREQRGPRD
jgi:chloride channel protein, CIC family